VTDWPRRRRAVASPRAPRSGPRAALSRGLGALAAVLAFVVAPLLAPPGPRPAVAQDVPGRTLGVWWQEGAPRLYFSARDLVTAEVRRKLESGLPQTLVLRVYAYDEAAPAEPVAVAPLGCRVTRDFLDDTYRVQLQSDDGDRTESVPTLDAVLRRCLVVRGLQVGRAERWQALRGRRVTFAVLVELNPLSPDTVRRIRRWLATSGGGRVENDAFFGSFVSLFVNRRIGSAERTLTFRSQPVSVP
jgi:hypothetical protein